jgi:hypothetical protein
MGRLSIDPFRFTAYGVIYEIARSGMAIFEFPRQALGERS